MPKTRPAYLQKIVDEANAVMRTSVNSYDRERKGLDHFVSKLLMDAKVYRGFRYLTEAEVEKGYTFGIIFDGAGNHVYPDQTRIAFY